MQEFFNNPAALLGLGGAAGVLGIYWRKVVDLLKGLKRIVFKEIIIDVSKYYYYRWLNEEFYYLSNDPKIYLHRRLTVSLATNNITGIGYIKKFTNSLLLHKSKKWFIWVSVDYKSEDVTVTYIKFIVTPKQILDSLGKVYLRDYKRSSYSDNSRKKTYTTDIRVTHNTGSSRQIKTGSLSEDSGSDPNNRNDFHKEVLYPHHQHYNIYHNGKIYPSIKNYEEKGLFYNVEIYGEKPPKEINSSYVLSNELLAIENEIFNWSSFTYMRIIASLGMPHKRGYLLAGPPGTGKSSFIVHISMLLHCSVEVFYLDTFNSTDFLSKIKDIKDSSTMTIVVFEEIDNIFNGRERVNTSHNKTDLTFDTLLTAVDGVDMKTNSSILYFFTTNHIDRIDPALLRPGRIDKVIHFSLPSKEVLQGIADNIFNKVKEHSIIEDIIKQGIDLDKEASKMIEEALELNYTNAQFEDKCKTYLVDLITQIQLTKQIKQ